MKVLRPYGLLGSKAQGSCEEQQIPQETPEDLVSAEVEHLDRLLSVLTKAARLSCCLPTSRILGRAAQHLLRRITPLEPGRQTAWWMSRRTLAIVSASTSPRLR